MKDYGFIFDEQLSFEEKAERVYAFQYEHNKVYRRFCDALLSSSTPDIEDIPFLPVEAFRDATVLSSNTGNESELIFQSSGTSGMKRSRHEVLSPILYRESLLRGFRHFYPEEDQVILAYTPGYNENPHSSLIHMLRELISEYQPDSSRFLEVGKALGKDLIDYIQKVDRRIILFGATFGLMDLVEMGGIKLPENSVVIETGGMKTYRREMSRDEMHLRIAEGFGLSESQVHSEYGMTELLSQAYAQGDDWFKTVPWMKVSIRDPEDPMKEMPDGQEGLIGVIDLANLYSCSFLLTGDRGTRRADGRFQVLGRWYPSDLRGCNFLIDQEVG